MEGYEECEGAVHLGAKFVKIALKQYLQIALSANEIELLDMARDYCIREAAKNEIRFK